jgi:hypothetical protein
MSRMSKDRLEKALEQLKTISEADHASMLLGDRAALGRPARSLEVWAARLLGPMSWMMPKGVRPIHARAVASALLTAILTATPGVRVLKSGAMQAHDHL